VIDIDISKLKEYLINKYKIEFCEEEEPEVPFCALNGGEAGLMTG
jgi:hypothetical protein